ncbi:unnamed protein product [Rhizoctonia solani]|uniref:GYF domain-containing protein n=1 Tax=Rhizoctonia solani TaxID=456999 RepID=A0A8H3HE30_9AGAM|nr:unnamed protein product [Rhizoctonia solani]
MSTRPIKRATSGAGPSTKRTRFTDPSDPTTNGDDQSFAEQVDENLETVSSRKGVKTEGYDSDSSDDGEGVVESRKKKAAEDDDDDDMFAAPDPDKAKQGQASGKKQEKYLALGDIEGQEFGRTTADSSGEDEPEDEDDAERKKKEGMGYEISSFNMKAEMEEGKFAEDGTFVRSFDPHAVHDKWMEGMDEREMKKAKRSKKMIESREREREQREAKEAERGKEDVMKELLGFMQKGETVLETLQRLGSTSKVSRRGQKKKAATEVLPQAIDGTTTAEKPPEEDPVTRVTSLASTLMSLGDSDVYEATYEMMLRLVKRSGIVSADWDPHPPPPQTPDTKYEYRWAPDYVAASGGQASADAVYGPYGATEMGAWKAASYFGDDAERVQVRRVGDNDWSSWDAVFPA